jgi:hypothetical protein
MVLLQSCFAIGALFSSMCTLKYSWQLCKIMKNTNKLTTNMLTKNTLFTHKSNLPVIVKYRVDTDENLVTFKEYDNIKKKYVPYKTFLSDSTFGTSYLLNINYKNIPLPFDRRMTYVYTGNKKEFSDELNLDYGKGNLLEKDVMYEKWMMYLRGYDIYLYGKINNGKFCYTNCNFDPDLLVFNIKKDNMLFYKKKIINALFGSFCCFSSLYFLL